MNDHELLACFVADRDVPAFAELVRRHMDMVYSSARRQVRDSQTAEDVAQRVFVLLAQKARMIRSREALAGWLLTATRFMALDGLRQQARRRKYESEAAAMKNEANTPAEPVWDAIQPMLDEFVAKLKPADRDAVALRYFQRLSLAEVAATLVISEPAAQKRVHRALSRLRTLFLRNGITTSVEALGLALSTNVCSPAPNALAGSVAHAAADSAVLAGASTFNGAMQLMAAIKTKLVIGVCAAVVMGAPAIYLGVQGFGSSASVSQAAQASGAADSKDWKPAFDRVYSLKPDEVVKHIPPPFIPERADFWAAQQTSTFVPTGQTPPPAPQPLPKLPQPNWMSLLWKGDHLQLTDAVTGDDRELAELLRSITGIAPQDTDIPREQLLKKFYGDWIVRQGATKEQRIAALPRGLLGRGMTLKLETMDRDVIVVDGRFMPKAPPTLPRSVAALPPGAALVFLYRTRPGLEPVYTNACGNQREFLDVVGHMLLRPIVVEGQLGQPGPVVYLRLAGTADFLRAIDASDAAAADELLKLISEQTSLQLTRQRRAMPTWRLVKE